MLAARAQGLPSRLALALVAIAPGWAEAAHAEKRVILTLPDRPGAELYRLDRPVKAYWIKFTIEGVFPGKTYSDTAISKLLVSSEPAR